MPNRKLYGEEAKVGEPPKQPAFNWGCGVMLSALNAGARVDRKFKPWLREYADAVQVYWNGAGPVAGFDVWPVPKPTDRYYDDNAWMVLALVETHEVLGDAKYLEHAKKTLRYVFSGEDAKLGGGIYWKENYGPNEQPGKNTCSNGPSVAAALAVWKHTKSARSLAAAQRIYAWTRRNLRDSEDGLYWDGVGLDGRVDKTKWSYNTGLMIRSAAMLYGATKNPIYLRDAREAEAASLKKWAGGALKDEGKFAHLLMESWIYKRRHTGQRAPATRAAMLQGLSFLHEKGRDASGHYPGRWDRIVEKPLEKFSLIDQASAARGYFMAALELKRR